MPGRKVMTPSRIKHAMQSVLREHHELATIGITSDLVAAVAGCFDCTFATYWKVQAESSRLTPAVLWNIHGPADALLGVTKNRSLSMSEGTAGQVWRSRKPIWTTNLIHDMCLPRSLEANFAGLHAGIWFAVKTSNTVFGVMELLADALPPASQDLLSLVERLGLSLGHCSTGGNNQIEPSDAAPAPSPV